MRKLFDNIKNIPGWQTSDRLVVFSVDDYGNVRLDSKEARDKMYALGIPLNGRFDYFDALETTQDLNALFETLSSVRDSLDRHPVFTPYAICANPDFDAISKTHSYVYEPLPNTFERLAADRPNSYSGTWSVWNEGINSGFLKPQFHGREHLNLELLERKFKCFDVDLKINIENHSMAGLVDDPHLPGVGFTQSFGIWQKSGIIRHREVLKDGMELFQSVFGYPSITFTPPSQRLHPDLYSYVESLGVRAIDKPFHCVRKLDTNDFVHEFNKLGRRNGQGHISIVRNVVFEPTNNRSFDSVQFALKQISTAFRWKKPAIISSHRVNYCGLINEDNRAFGLNELKRLLHGIVLQWPDVQFINAVELVNRIDFNL